MRTQLARTIGESTTGVIFLLLCLSLNCAPAQTDYLQLRSFGLPALDGRDPRDLIEGTDGLLYGVTASGGNNNSSGTLFSLTKDGTGYLVLRNFTNSTAAYPVSLIDGGDGSEWPLIKASIIAGAPFPVTTTVGDFHELAAGLIEQGVGFGPTLDRARLPAIGSKGH